MGRCIKNKLGKNDGMGGGEFGRHCYTRWSGKACLSFCTEISELSGLPQQKTSKEKGLDVGRTWNSSQHGWNGVSRWNSNAVPVGWKDHGRKGVALT